MKLSISILQVEQVTQSYVDWYSNEEVVRYSDNQYRKFSFDGQCSYVQRCLRNEDVNLYGIFDDTTHVGNIVIRGLSSHHRKAELTYVIGQTNYWGKGVASFAIANMIQVAKEEFDLNKLYAGIASGNIGSGKVLEKNGFIVEGTRKQHLSYGGNFFDQVDYGLVLRD
jgi:[ribosomal protein S5]-alanine N-acetyltransferase